MLQMFLHSFEWFLFPLSQKFIGIIEFPCLCKNPYWPHGKLIYVSFFPAMITQSVSRLIFWLELFLLMKDKRYIFWSNYFATSSSQLFRSLGILIKPTNNPVISVKGRKRSFWDGSTNHESPRSKCHFRFRVTIISSLSTMYRYLVLLQRKKVAKECLTKQHLGGEKEGKVHLEGWAGVFS